MHPSDYNSTQMRSLARGARVGIVAPSSKIPQVELSLGVEKLRHEGFKVSIHPQCRKKHLFFAGTDEERARAFFDYAKDPNIDVIWCARGGHGAIRLLPLLERMSREEGVPSKKLLVGFSDVTILMEYTRHHWCWYSLHASMPSFRKFGILNSADWKAMSAWVSRRPTLAPWAGRNLKFWACPPKTPVVGQMTGGNLTVMNCLIGTRFQAKLDGNLLFLEDVDESLYRLDRLIQHLSLSGSLDQVKGIVLGNFLNCKDHVPSVLKARPKAKNRTRVLESPKKEELTPLRRILPEDTTLRGLFTELGQRLQIPIAYGLPVGHGPGVSPLPLGAEYVLHPNGRLELREWAWLKK